MNNSITRERLEEIVSDPMINQGSEFAMMARMALAAMDSRESVELPLDYLQGHKDGLEWASQQAEANHPETGDWLYDDPIELAKAIRKGPDMPPAQPVADSEPVAYSLIFRNMDGVLNNYINTNTTFSTREKAEAYGKGGSYEMRSDGRLEWVPNTALDPVVVPLYRHAQQSVVIDDLSIFEAAIEECKTCDSIDEHAWNNGVLVVMAKYESCRAAMLSGGNDE